MPVHDMVWLSVSAARPRIEIDVNDVTVARLGGSSGRSLPINEFIVPGDNRIVVRLADRLTDDPPLPPRDGKVTLSVTHSRWDGEEQVSAQPWLDAELSYVAAQVHAGATLVEATFHSPLPSVAPGRVTMPIGAASRPAIVAQLTRAADWWRHGDVDALLAWTDDYVSDYVHAYPSEVRAEYQNEVRATFDRYAGGRVTFDPAAVMLLPRGGGRLVDARAADMEPAIRIEREDGDVYRFWTTLGMTEREVVFVR